MKWLGLWFIIMLLMALSNIANADDPHGAVIQEGSPSITYSKSQALALAFSEIDATVLSDKWQFGVGFGDHEGETAYALGVHKRIAKNLLFGGKIGEQNGSVGKSFGFNYKAPF